MKGAGVVVVAIIAAYAATAALIPVAVRIGFVAGFNPIVPQRRLPAALGGGIGIFTGVLAGIAFGAWDGLASEGLGRSAIAIAPSLLVGLVDDARALSPRTKLCLQMFSAVLGLILFAGMPSNGPQAFAFVVSMVCAVVLMNAFNFLDVSDGYAASIAAVSFAGVALSLPANVSAMAVAGACIGFLGLNLPPARVYMGDAGSLSLGMMGGLQIYSGSLAVGAATAISISVVSFGVALFELVGVTAIRKRKGLSIWRGSPDHSALRLQRLGLSKRSILLLASTVQSGFILCWWVFARATVG